MIGSSGKVGSYRTDDIDAKGGKIINNMISDKIGKGGDGSLNGIFSAGGGSGCGAVLEITREMMKGNKVIKIKVGAKGKKGTYPTNVNFNGEDGYDGYASIEYYG